MKPDYEDYYGDEQDGVYVKTYECPDGTWRNEVIVDCDSAGFVDTLDECGGYATAQESRDGGKNIAIDWCVTNQVSWTEEE
jgi:hypothetical protein